VTAAPLGDTAARLEEGAATVRHEGTSVQLLMTLAVPADEVLFGVFTADSTESLVGSRISVEEASVAAA
jgi:hypothetical protein